MSSTRPSPPTTALGPQDNMPIPYLALESPEGWPWEAPPVEWSPAPSHPGPRDGGCPEGLGVQPWKRGPTRYIILPLPTVTAVPAFLKHLLCAGCPEWSNNQDTPCPLPLEAHSREGGKNASSGPPPRTPSPQSPELFLCFFGDPASMRLVVSSPPRPPQSPTSPTPPPAFFDLAYVSRVEKPAGGVCSVLCLPAAPRTVPGREEVCAEERNAV